jgi:hypothetical protein
MKRLFQVVWRPRYSKLSVGVSKRLHCVLWGRQFVRVRLWGAEVTILRRLVTPMVVALLLASGCSTPAAPTPAAATDPFFDSTPAAPPTTPPVSMAEPTATPVPPPTPRAVSTPQPLGPCGVGALALPNPDRPVYRGSLTVDPPTRRVEGFVSVVFTPDLDVDALYVRLWPNGPRTSPGGVAMELTNVSFENGPVHFDVLEPTIVRINVPGGLAAGTSIEFEMSFELVVPQELESRLSGRDDYMRLGTMLPILPWEPGLGWALDPPTSLFAESVSSPVADYAIQVQVPEGYDVLASGIVDDDGVWRVESARDFSLSVGGFRTVTGTALAPEPVVVTVGVHETIADDPQIYLDKIIASLEQFSSRWGQYPWPSLTFAVTPNLSGGIEFPTHIMQGPNTQGRVTSHEVGHMFFYSLVGNNQSAAPWLDEGLTSYAEFTFEGSPANAFEVPAAGLGNATEPMTFWESRPDIYYRSVYAQTGFALQLLGPQADVDCALARYVAQNAHQIATAEDFVAAFQPTFPDIIEQMAALGVVLDR